MTEVASRIFRAKLSRAKLSRAKLSRLKIAEPSGSKGSGARPTSPKRSGVSAVPGRPARLSSSRALKTKAIFRATIDELVRADYGALTIERIAARAGVNKTTVYRRWPRKSDLVRASLVALTKSATPGSTSGSLRSDLLRLSHQMVKFAASSDGQSLLRLRLLKHPEPELAEIARTLHAGQQAERERLVTAAIERGELRPGVDPRMLIDMLGGALQIRLYFRNERVDGSVIQRMVDTLLDGALARPSPGE